MEEGEERREERRKEMREVMVMQEKVESGRRKELKWREEGEIG